MQFYGVIQFTAKNLSILEVNNNKLHFIKNVQILKNIKIFINQILIKF